MLAFLVSIASLVYQLFQSFWGVISWLCIQAFGVLLHYVNVLHAGLLDYANSKRYHLSWYADVARPRSDDITYYNYGATRYTAVDSYPVVQEYRLTLIDRVRIFAGALYTFVYWLTMSARSSVERLYNTPFSMLDFILGKGGSSIQDYDTNDKPTVKTVKTYAHQIESNFSQPKVGILNDLTTTLFTPIKSFVVSQLPDVTDLLKYKAGIISLSGAEVASKVHNMVVRDYDRVQMILSKSTEIDGLTNSKTYSRLHTLTESNFSRLVDVTDRPSDYVLAAIRDKFLGWLLEIVLYWLSN